MVVRLSPLAKIAATVGSVGALLAIYGHLKSVEWASKAGPVALFAGAVVYFIERMRMLTRKRPPGGPPQPPTE